MNQDQEVIEMSLEKVIHTKLIQNNVTDQVLNSLKEKYGNLKLESLDNKESFLEIKEAAKVCAKVRTLAVKVCKEGREEAVKVQKLWIAEEKRVVGRVAEVEDALDAEAAKYEQEQARLANEEKERQESAYINRQATLTKMGARYEDGCFILGDASFEANLIKGSSDDVWEEAVIPKFRAEEAKIMAVELEKERVRAEEAEKVRAEQEKLRQEQEEFRLQQEAFKKQQAEAQRIIDDKLRAEKAEADRIAQEEAFKIREEEMAKQAEAKRLADIEAAIQKEQARQAEEARLAEEAKQKVEADRIAALEAAGDKTKWEDFIEQVKKVHPVDMRSGQYRKKMQVAKELLDKILAL